MTTSGFWAFGWDEVQQSHSRHSWENICRIQYCNDLEKRFVTNGMELGNIVAYGLHARRSARDEALSTDGGEAGHGVSAGTVVGNIAREMYGRPW